MQKAQVVLITPSRYDERGVRIFRIGINQNGSLGAIAGMIVDYNDRHRGRRQVDFEVFDEHVREPITVELLRSWRDRSRAAGTPFAIFLCGIQTPFYPRARDIALMAKREGIEVIAGGVHFTAHGPSVDFFTRCGISVGIGEVEPIWDQIVDDLFDGNFRPLYRIGADTGIQVKTAVSDIFAPDLTHAPYPHMPRRYLSHYLNPHHLYIDASRGCPFVCTFCSVKNTFGRTMRSRDPEELVAWMGERVQSGDARWFTFTDDNFVRNPRHLEILEGLARLRQRGLQFSLCLSLDVEAASDVDDPSPRGERTRHFLELCKAAGVSNVSMGLESTNDEALKEMRKNVNRERRAKTVDIHEAILKRYRTAVQAFQSINASVECGYIIGFDADAAGAGRQAALDMLAIGVDIVNFHLIAALPGAEDYARARRDGRLLVDDFNECFRHTAMIAHPELTPAQLEAEVAVAIRKFYSLPNVLRRLVNGIFGVGRPRVRGMWIFAKRQLGFKLMLWSGLQSYAEGGVFRRATGVGRAAITDQEALHHYLERRTPEHPPLVAEAMLDEGRMDSLPILSQHSIG
jgi:radical SAM superfamily enzyme YgiQ (UPF0313 family)